MSALDRLGFKLDSAKPGEAAYEADINGLFNEIALSLTDSINMAKTGEVEEAYKLSLRTSEIVNEFVQVLFLWSSQERISNFIKTQKDKEL